MDYSVTDRSLAPWDACPTSSVRLDIEHWNRKEHYLFFKEFEEPFFKLCVEIDCTKGYRSCKETGKSFFLYYLYQSLTAANEIEPFRYRIVDDHVEVFKHIHASPTIGREDGTFGFSFIAYQPTFDEFQKTGKQEIERVRKGQGLMRNELNGGVDLIHFSSLPWIKFTALSNARSFSFKDSVPKISFGKLNEQGDRWMMPVSIHVHHALIDGLPVGRFIDRFQELMDGDGMPSIA